MLVKKSTSLREIWEFSGHHLWWLIMHMFVVSVLYKELDWTWISIPWLPVSLVGTALAFYIGFKNNQAYDRVWEARKIWGAIVNSSRSWGAMVSSFVRNSPETHYSNEELTIIRERLIFRHIAWLYTLRDQLLIPAQWEHVRLKWLYGRLAERRRQNGGIGLFLDYITETQKAKYFFDDAALQNAANKATQLINLQSLDIADLQEKDILHMRRQLDMQKVLGDFYDHQGRAERIKRFPLPRQYANLSFIFNCIFIFLLPLGIVAEFNKLGEAGVWLMIPFGTIVGWIYVVMELIGDYSENPFEGMGTDIPMLSICRTIEIDLLQMIGETDLPKPVAPVKNVLM